VPQIRKLLIESQGLDGEKISAAEKLAQESMIGIPAGMPGYSTLGDLYLRGANNGTIATIGASSISIQESCASLTR